MLMVTKKNRDEEFVLRIEKRRCSRMSFIASGKLIPAKITVEDPNHCPGLTPSYSRKDYQPAFPIRFATVAAIDF